MCGIVGFIDKNSKKDKDELIKKMADRIKHRGPDAAGYYTDHNVALGHRRLSIIDLNAGSQPIFNEDETKLIIFNGEIYNYQALKEDLIKKGHKFKTETDTEVILHGYEEYQEELFNKLRGMFAFVIYDKETEELIGARDHFGIKPFYYYQNKKTFMFASEIKAFLEHPEFKKEVNTDALKMYLIFQYSIHEETFFKGVFKLKPGHYFKFKDGKLEIKEYFNICYQKEHKSYDDFKDEIKEVLEDSIKYHEITSDVEVGTYLSGGVDSSYVASVANPKKSFTVGFDLKGFDETKMAQELSDMLKIKNYSKYISSDEFFDILPTVLYHTDEPHANLSTIPLYFLSELASKHVKVVLSGEGSDEMFGGYNEYYEPKLLRIYKKIPLFIRSFIAFIVKPFPHFPGQNTLILYGKPLYSRYIGHGSYMTEEEANLILKEDLRTNETIKDNLKPITDKVKFKDDITKKMLIDMHYWLPQDILLKADKMSMANSLELRVPLLDAVLFDHARKIPTKYLVKDKQTKHLFRTIAHKELPDAWAKRQKLGFPVPFAKWAREEKYYNLIKDYFNKPYVDLFFDKSYINNLLEEHYHNKKSNTRKIYNVFIFLIWYEVYFVNEKA